ncbi:hypothetical protein KCH_23880 [Kitasatospora cheerisanensis KCTC 2395]|uniref:Uncharacterized protein n=1 Tax=Kitasatospora cheerisanensis KCTC 2395 TaxID=1348663 RepID=A0A066Z6G0_9ACTN|nr:hypothetical protein KCH_23880 [Kitasatospora cheerisanensis KCTC 2395]
MIFSWGESACLVGPASRGNYVGVGIRVRAGRVAADRAA